MGAILAYGSQMIELNPGETTRVSYIRVLGDLAPSSPSLPHIRAGQQVAISMLTMDNVVEGPVAVGRAVVPSSAMPTTGGAIVKLFHVLNDWLQ